MVSLIILEPLLPIFGSVEYRNYGILTVSFIFSLLSPTSMLSSFAAPARSLATHAARSKHDIQLIYHSPLLDLVFRAASVHRQHHDPRKLQLCTLMNIKCTFFPPEHLISFSFSSQLAAVQRIVRNRTLSPRSNSFSCRLILFPIFTILNPYKAVTSRRTRTRSPSRTQS